MLSKRNLRTKAEMLKLLFRRNPIDDENFKNSMSQMKGRLGYLTQKFTEYLTQNTFLQGQLQARDGAVRKMEAAYKDHTQKIEDQKQQLGMKINELEEKIKQGGATTTTTTSCETAEIGTDTPFSPVVSQRIMNEKLNGIIENNKSLLDRYEGMKLETEKLKSELKDKQTKPLDTIKCDTTQTPEELRKSLQNFQTTEEIARTLIEGLKMQLESAKNDKEEVEAKLKESNQELSELKLENVELNKKVGEYKLEFNYLQECLNERICRNSESNDSMGYLPEEDEADEKGNEADNESEKSDNSSPHDSKEGLKIIHNYIGKLNTLEQRTKVLDDEIRLTDRKINKLKKEADKEKLTDGLKQGVVSLYKKIIENKHSEISNLKKRLKEKTNMVNGNVKLLSKLESSFNQRLDQLSEANRDKERMSRDNARLQEIVKSNIQEFEKLKKEFNESRSVNNTPKTTTRCLQKKSSLKKQSSNDLESTEEALIRGLKEGSTKTKESSSERLESTAKTLVDKMACVELKMAALFRSKGAEMGFKSEFEMLKNEEKDLLQGLSKWKENYGEHQNDKKREENLVEGEKNVNDTAKEVNQFIQNI